MIEIRQDQNNSKKSFQRHQNKSESGQIVVEYILLLSIAVAIAMIIITLMVKRDPSDLENSGALIRKWQMMQETVGKDQQN